MSEVAEKTAEAVAENVEDVVDGIVDVVEVVRNNPVTLAIVGVLGLAAGGVGGYFFAKKSLRDHYEEIITQEIAEAKLFYANFYKVDENGAALSPKDVLEDRHGAAAAAEAVRTYQGRQMAETIVANEEIANSVDEEDERQIRKIEEARIHSISVDKEPGPGGGTIEVVEETQTRNVFAEPSFDLEEETKLRTDDRPYIITQEEYYAAEKDYDTVSLTYYEEDDTLTDEHDKPVNEVDKVIGDDQLVRFGHGSGDKNIVFVRNDRLQTDYEVVKSSGSYVKQVLGMLDQDPRELKHSDQRDRRRAFRHGEG